MVEREAEIQGVLFDKDGTLFDFERTWGAWAVQALGELAEGDAARAARYGAALGFDLETARFDPQSPIIAGTPADIVAALAPLVPGRSPEDLIAHLNATAAKAPQVSVVSLPPVLSQLRQMGLRLGVATNDGEAPARAHLSEVSEFFDFIAGYDSGYGGKPAPGMCLAFAEAMGLDPSAILMVGDSTHDLHAGHAAGMRTVGVLTGMAGAADLAPYATVVLPDIGALPAWIAAQG